ncbi:MAG: hypothetical protein QM791_11605 [Ferruginibacter sp.]
MKWIFTKKFWISFISILLTGAGIVLACGGDWGPEYGISNFTPEAFVEKKYTPFFYSQQFYYGINYDGDQNSRFNESNKNDWAGYLENKVPQEELNFLLTEASKEFIDSLAAYVNGTINTLPAQAASYQWLKAGRQTKDFINYLSLAKEAGIFANNTAAWWDYEQKKTTSYENAPALNKALLAGLNKAGDKFLKQRYWFQLVRSYFFNGELALATELFEKNEGNFEKNKMYYRTLGYAAGALYKQKEYAKANYYYSLVFDGCDELKMSAHYSFHPQEEADWQATLALCKSKEEKITLWQMLGIFYGDEKRSINEIYKLDPSSNKSDLLLARAINKEEQKMSEYDESTYTNKIKIGPLKIDDSLRAMVTAIAGNNKTGNAFLWQTAAAYLEMLAGKYAQAENYYKLAEKSITNDPLQASQLRLLKLVNKVVAAPKADSKLENGVLADIQWLNALTADDGTPFRYKDAFGFIKQSMAKKYRRQNDLVKSECYITRPAFYSSNKNVEAIKAFLLKDNKTAYEKLCASLYVDKVEDLYEYQAIRLAFDDKLSDAIALLEKTGDKANAQLMGNPFNGRISDCHDCDHEAYKGTPYTKISLLRKMNEMKTNIIGGKDVYNNALLLGNAFYNMSHYGNARLFYESAIVGSYHYSPFSIDTVFRGFIIDTRQAATYYQKALAAATNNEQKAKCHYMLAKCERNEWYNKNMYSVKDDNYSSGMVNLKAISNFKMLKQYAATKYYQDVINECGYFKTYIKQ